MRPLHILLLGIIAAAVLVACMEVRPELETYDPAHNPGISRVDWDRRTHISYWEKWGSFEAEACQAMVDDFNRTQDEVYVHYVRTSEVNRKAMLAIVGHDPPDVVGLWTYDLAPFVDAGALTPLDDRMKQAGLTDDYYTASYLALGRYGGVTYALPTAPSSDALFYNKEHFRRKAEQLLAAGLDPNRPPRTIEELDRYSEILSEFAPDGTPRIMGFLPSEPEWYGWAWGYYFGGQLYDPNTGRITTDCPANIRAYCWVKRYAEKFGRSKLLQFRSGFGNFDSPQNAFIDGKVSMEKNGVWFPNFINRHRPHLEYGVAPFPTAQGVPGPVSTIDADVIAIPRGCRHAEAAWKFIVYVQKRGLTILCRLQGKHTPLRNPPADFRQGHPNPHLAVFEEVAASPHSFPLPKLTIWQEYRDRMDSTFQSIWNWPPPEDQLKGLDGPSRQRKIEELCRQMIAGKLAEVRSALQAKLDAKAQRDKMREGGR